MKKTVRTIEYTWEEKTHVVVERQHRSTTEIRGDEANMEKPVPPGELEPADAGRGEGEQL